MAFTIEDFKQGRVQVVFYKESDSLLELSVLMGNAFGFGNLKGLTGGFGEQFYKAKEVSIHRDGKFLGHVVNGDWRGRNEPFVNTPIQCLKCFNLTLKPLTPMKTIINNTHLVVDVKLATTEVQWIKPGQKIEVDQRPTRYRLHGGLWQDLAMPEFKNVSVISFTF